MALAAKQKTLVGLSEGNQKSIMANRSYQQWLLNKQIEEQQKNKEKKVEQEWEALQKKQRLVEQEKAQISFSSWKNRKDLERDFKSENSIPSSGRETLATVRDTPLLPGYCSVWSCDDELADHMLTRIQRQISANSC